VVPFRPMTIKWSDRTAQEPVGFCREAAAENSPGLQPWVSRRERSALPVRRSFGEIGTKEEKWRPRLVFWCSVSKFTGHTPSSGATFRAPLPRHQPRVETLGYSLKPFHGSTLFTSQTRKNLHCSRSTVSFFVRSTIVPSGPVKIN
jgi:hypothetical protein